MPPGRYDHPGGTPTGDMDPRAYRWANLNEVPPDIGAGQIANAKRPDPRSSLRCSNNRRDEFGGDDRLPATGCRPSPWPSPGRKTGGPTARHPLDEKAAPI